MNIVEPGDYFYIYDYQIRRLEKGEDYKFELGPSECLCTIGIDLRYLLVYRLDKDIACVLVQNETLESSDMTIQDALHYIDIALGKIEKADITYSDYTIEVVGKIGCQLFDKHALRHLQCHLEAYTGMNELSPTPAVREDILNRITYLYNATGEPVRERGWYPYKHPSGWICMVRTDSTGRVEEVR